jgi:hypothetical protein
MELPLSHWLTVSGVINMTGIAFSWTGWTTPWFGGHDREEHVVADVRCLLGSPIARPRPPDPGEEERPLVRRSNHGHSMAPLGVFLSGSENAVAGTMQRCSLSSHCATGWLQGAEVRAVRGAWLERREAPQHVLTHDVLAILRDHDWRAAVGIDILDWLVLAALALFPFRPGRADELEMRGRWQRRMFNPSSSGSPRSRIRTE